MDRFKTKIAVITGAGSGLGRGLALEFAKLNWRVAVCDIEESRISETVRLVNEAGGEGLPVQCDVTQYEQIEAMAKAVLGKWGGADILINNAGVPVSGYFEKIPLENWRFEIDVMLMSVIYGCRVFIPVFKKQGWGHIVNTASAAAITASGEMGPYSITKAGVVALSETLYSEFRGCNIGTTVLCPSFFKTNLLDKARYCDERQRRMAEAFFEKYSTGTVESVSRAALKGIRKNKLYVLPQLDIKIMWFMKRMAPSASRKLDAFLYSRGFIDRLLGIDGKRAAP